MTTKAKDSSRAMLEWQYKTILSELQQIELHESGDCPCILSTLKPPEKCLGKHTLNVFSLTAETAQMDSSNAKMLRAIGEKANEFHDKYKDFICHTGNLPDLRDWARSARKEIEPVYYSCGVKKASLRDAAAEIAKLFAPKYQRLTVMYAPFEGQPTSVFDEKGNEITEYDRPGDAERFALANAIEAYGQAPFREPRNLRTALLPQITAGLRRSQAEEGKAVKIYRVRMKSAENQGDIETVKVYKHVIPQEAEHAVEFSKRLAEV